MKDTSTYLLKSVRVTDPMSAWNHQEVDVLIRAGVVEEIDGQIDRIPEGCRVLEEFTCISPGWVDPWNHGAKPGEEHHQTLQEWIAQLAQSGITTVALSPTKSQCIEQVAGVDYRPFSHQMDGISVHSFAPHSHKMEGQHMVNYQLLAQAGAVGFTDAFPNKVSKALMIESAKYTSILEGARIWVVLPDPGLGRTFQVWEGDTALSMGLEGMPMFEERFYLQQLSTLVEYTGKAAVYPLLSSASGLEKWEAHSGLTLGTAAHYLWWSDKSVAEFNEGYKFWPPLSPHSDQAALVQGLKSGCISFLCSDHRPYHSDARETAFPDAPFGQSTLPSFSLAGWTRLRSCMQPSEFIQIISHNSRALLGLPSIRICPGSEAEFTFWNPEGQTLGALDSPWANCVLDGEIQGRMIQGQLHLTE
jgi:dihydroorotase